MPEPVRLQRGAQLLRQCWWEWEELLLPRMRQPAKAALQRHSPLRLQLEMLQ